MTELIEIHGRNRQKFSTDRGCRVCRWIASPVPIIDIIQGKSPELYDKYAGVIPSLREKCVAIQSSHILLPNATLKDKYSMRVG